MLDFLPDNVNERMLTVILISFVAGLFLGYFMWRTSNQRKKVNGGTPAQVFHYLACSTFSILIPAIFFAILSELPILRVIGTGMTFSLSTWIFLFGYAAFEPRIVETKPKIELD